MFVKMLMKYCFQFCYDVVCLSVCLFVFGEFFGVFFFIYIIFYFPLLDVSCYIKYILHMIRRRKENQMKEKYILSRREISIVI